MELKNLILDSICRVRGDVSCLSVQEKQWLGTEVVEGRTTITTLARRVGLPRRAVKRYAHKVRHHCIFLGKPGRRRLLDGQSVNLIRHWATENDCAADDENMESLVEKINSEKVETLSRLHIGNYEGILGPIRRVSQRSLGRYVKLVLPQ